MCDDFKRKLSEMDNLDENIIGAKPWAQQLLAHTLKITRKAVLNWCNIVIKIGEAELDIDEYVSIFTGQVENLYEELITDVDAIQERSLDKIARLLEQMQNSCRDLHVDIPTFNFEEVPLCDLYKLVQRRVQEFESLIEIRRKELKELHQKQLKLCKSLGREPKLLAESPLPLPRDLEGLRVYIETLENDAIEREEKFFQLKEDIVEMVKELRAPPSLDFETDILNLTNTEVRITDSDMEQLESYHGRLLRQLTTVKEEISELRNKVDDLWNKLETDIAERDAFRRKNIGNSLETLDALKTEVKKLDEMKKANIKVFIMKQRQELAEWWEKCHCTEIERGEFNFYYSECYNEDLFELHERETEKWKAYYEENNEIFALLQEYKKLWNDHLQLEMNSGCSANRYKNRGGQLLMEEKLRNKFRKRIPKIEESLLRLAETFFMRKGRHFRTFGRTIQEYISKLHEDEDKEFKLKLSAKKQQREQASTVGRSRMNLFPPSSSALNPTLTPRHCSKRKIMTTPVTEPFKKLKTGGVNRVSKTGLPKLNVSRSKRRSARREKLRQRLSFKSSQRSSDKENHNETASTSYHDFEKEVSMRNNCRSTGFVLKESQATVLPFTPGDNFLTPGVAFLQKTPRPKRVVK